MYFQLFITNRSTQKKSQFSCDTFQEVQEVVEQRKPKFVSIEYYDCTGLVGVAYKYFDWGFYLGRRNVSLETMTKDEIMQVLRESPFGFSDETLEDMDRRRRYEYAKQKSYEK